MRLKKVWQTPRKILNISQSGVSRNHTGILERGEWNPLSKPRVMIASGPDNFLN